MRKKTYITGVFKVVLRRIESLCLGMTNVLALELWLDHVWRSSKFKTFCPGFISLRKERGGGSPNVRVHLCWESTLRSCPVRGWSH